MRKWIKTIGYVFVIPSTILLAMSTSVRADTGNTTPPTLLAQSAVLMDMTTGQIIYEKNPYEKLYPASITKIMTALLALKYGHLNDPIKASVNAVNQEPDKVYLVPGEVHSLQQMLYGLLIDSANDAAVAIAEHYGGSVKGFANMMNQEAKQLGAINTHFVNPNGLQNANHYTCAYDMALIARQAMQNPEFRKIVSTKFYLWKGKEWTSNLSNLNEMLWSYPGANGVKTGWTDQAEQTMVVTATRNGHTLLAVLMKVPLLGEMQTDATNLLNYGFSSFQESTILPTGTKVASLSLGGHHATLSLESPLTALMPVHQTKKTSTSIAIPNTFTNVPVTQGLESIRDNRMPIPLVSPSPIVHSLIIAPIAYGVQKGAVIGSATIDFEHMKMTLPLQIDETIPVPVTPPNRLPELPALSLTLVCLGFSLIGRAGIKRTNKKKSRSSVMVYPRAMDK